MQEIDEHSTHTRDALFAGALQLRQLRKGHRAGTDGVLLAAMTPQHAVNIVDLGASTGVVGLRAAQINQQAEVLLVEREAELAALARENIALNALNARVEVLEADVFTLSQQPDLREKFDCTLTNPPYFNEASVRPSPDGSRASAHVFAHGSAGIEGWLKAAATITAPHGFCALIHRADAVVSLLPAFAKRFGAVTLRFVHPKAEQPAIRLLLSGIKGSRAPLTILPPIILHEDDGGMTQISARLHHGIGRLGEAI